MKAKPPVSTEYGETLIDAGQDRIIHYAVHNDDQDACREKQCKESMELSGQLYRCLAGTTARHRCNSQS